MFEIFASRARPTAASQPAKTSIVMRMGNIFIECAPIDVIVARMNRDSIIPSKHRSVDIRCDRNRRVPRSEKIKASKMLSSRGAILAIMMLS